MKDWKLEPAHDQGLSLYEQVRSVRREGGLFTSAGHLVSCVLTGSYLKLFHRLSIEGQTHIPKAGPFVLIANHASHLDALVLAASIPWRLRDQVFPVAAGDTFFSQPLRGIVSAVAMNALPMWRDRQCGHALTELRERLTADKVIYIIFPEGTRTRTGTMSPFKAGLGMLVASTITPVVPCHLSGSFEALPHNRRCPKPVKLHLNIGPAMMFERVPNDRSGWERVARTSESAVTNLGRVG